MGSDFEGMAKEREEMAAQLTDLDIWKSVVEKAVILETDAYVKADILLQSIPDIGVIFSQLKVQNQKGALSDVDYRDLLQVILEKLEKDMGMVDFDPTKYEQ